MRACYTLLITPFILLVYTIHAPAEVYNMHDGSVQVGHRISPLQSPVVHLETLTGIVVFPSDKVESIEDRDSLLTAYRKLSSHLNLDKVRCLTTLARWCRDKGLYEKMFELYDRVGAMEPDNPELKAFIYEMSNSMQYQWLDVKQLPDEKQGYALLLKIAKSKPTMKRIGEELVLSMPPEISANFILKGLKHSLPRVKLESIRILSIQIPDEAIEPLIAVALFDRKEETRKAAVDALKKYEHDGIIYPFLRALKTNVKAYRFNAINALAEFNDLRATGALIANLARGTSSPGSHRGYVYSGSQTSAVTDFDTEVAQSAVIANPIVSIIQDGVLLDVNVLGVSPGRIILKEERRRIADTLERITGMNYGEDYLMWKQWWLNNREKIVK